MTEIGVLAGLFASAFLSATLLPGSSEAALLALLAMGKSHAPTLIAVATVGNVLGSVVNWLIGGFLAHFRDRRWFPIDQKSYDRAASWYGRFGVWSLLLSWVPFIGDPLTVIAGIMREPFWSFLPIVALAKGARYIEQESIPA
jgi:membrane protein YqaA with SNARE-associated domain